MSKSKKRSSHHAPIGQRLAAGFGVFTESVEKVFKRALQSAGDVFANLFSILVPQSLRKKWEAAGKSRQAEKIGKQVGELTEQVEKRFTKGATGILSVLENVGAILIPEPVRRVVGKWWDAIWTRVRRISRQLARGIDRAAEKYLPRWMVQGIKRVSRSIHHAWQSAIRFVAVWAQSRDWYKLAWSTPAVLLAIPLVVCVALSPVYSSLQKIQHYNVAYGKALEEQDFDKASLFMKKLNQLGYQQMERAEYQQALALAAEDDYPSAYEMMQSISPIDEPGYLFGHIWIASTLSQGLVPEIPEDEAWRLINIHAEHVKAIEGTNQYADYLLMKIDQRNGTVSIPKMVELATEFPQFYGPLMVHYVKVGDLAQARVSARRFSAYIGDESMEERRTIRDYMLWASAQEILDDLEESRRITVEGSQRFADASELKQMAAIVLLAKLRGMDQTAPEALQVLKQAHIADANNETVIRSLASRLVYDKSLRARQIIDELRSAGKLNAEVFLVAGDLYTQQARYREAIELYVEAGKLNPASGRGFNNIAWIYANVSPVRLDLALGAVQQALDIENDPAYHETRGQILFRRSRDDWKQARDDLELSLNGTLPESDRQRANRTLAEIYNAWGDQEKADQHAQSAEPRSRFLPVAPPGAPSGSPFGAADGREAGNL